MEVDTILDFFELELDIYVAGKLLLSSFVALLRSEQC
jgi:hypothetical protein